MDMKTILLVLALGGTNALQLLGITLPTQEASTQTTKVANVLEDQLAKCYEELRQCNMECQ